MKNLILILIVLRLLSNIFDVSLDNLIEGDIENMKKIINESDRKGFAVLSIIYTIELFIMIVSAYPLLKYAGFIGIVIWKLFTTITIITAFEIERIKKLYNIQTYKEIVAFSNNKSLTRNEKIEENAKIPYQRFLLTLLSAIIAIIVFILIKVLIG